MRIVTSTRGRPSIASGKISKALTRFEAMSHFGRAPMNANACAISSPPVRIVAEPQRSSTMPPRPVAMILRIARDHFLGGAAADLPGVAGRDGARIDREEVAPGRQHVEPPARRRAGRTRRHEAAVERAEQAAQLGGAAGRDALAQGVGGLGVEYRAPTAKPSALSGERPNTCSPSPIRMSLRSQSQASSAMQRRLRRLALGGAFPKQARRARALENQLRDRARAARIERLRLRRIHRTALRARAPRHASPRRRAAASDGRSSPRRSGVWPAPPRRDC